MTFVDNWKFVLPHNLLWQIWQLIWQQKLKMPCFGSIVEFFLNQTETRLSHLFLHHKQRGHNCSFWSFNANVSCPCQSFENRLSLEHLDCIKHLRPLKRCNGTCTVLQQQKACAHVEHCSIWTRTWVPVWCIRPHDLHCFTVEIISCLQWRCESAWFNGNHPVQRLICDCFSHCFAMRFRVLRGINR